MSKQKKQHYVPQFYMKNFADNIKRFNIVNVQSGDLIENVHIKGQCQANSFYNKENGDKYWENQLGKYETEWAHILQLIIREELITLSESQKRKIINFALFQDSRSTQARDSSMSKFWETLKIQLEMSGNNRINEENEQFLRNYFFESRKHTPAMLLDNTEKYLEYAQDLSVKIIKYETKGTLVSSDNPIISTNRIYPNVGIPMAGLLYFFPLSGNILVVIYDKKIYKNSESFSTSSNESEVKKLNRYQFIVSNKIVFGLDQHLIENYKSIIKLVKSERKRYWDSLLNVQVLGPPTKKVIMYEKPFVRNVSTFSFNRLSTLGYHLSLIPINNKDWFKRTPYILEDDFVRLDMRKNIVKTITLDTSMEIQIDKVNRFIELVKVYWGQN